MTQAARGAWGCGWRGLFLECIPPGSSPGSPEATWSCLHPRCCQLGLFSECAHELSRGARRPQCTLGHSVAPSQSCGCGSWELGLGRIWKLPCQGVGLALTSFYKNVVSPQLPNFWGLDSPAGGAVPCRLLPPLGAPGPRAYSRGSTLVWTMPGLWSLRCSRVAAMSISLAPARHQLAEFRWENPGDRSSRGLSPAHVPPARRPLRGPRSPSADQTAAALGSQDTAGGVRSRS